MSTSDQTPVLTSYCKNPRVDTLFGENKETLPKPNPSLARMSKAAPHTSRIRSFGNLLASTGTMSAMQVTEQLRA